MERCAAGMRNCRCLVSDHVIVCTMGSWSRIHPSQGMDMSLLGACKPFTKVQFGLVWVESTWSVWTSMDLAYLHAYITGGCLVPSDKVNHRIELEIRASWLDQQQHSLHARLRCCTASVFLVLHASRLHEARCVPFWYPRKSGICQSSRSSQTVFKKLSSSGFNFFLYTMSFQYHMRLKIVI